MDKIIKKFEELQEKVLGFVRYVVRGSRGDFAVDVYTMTGLLIKTKLSSIDEHDIKDFISKHSIYLNNL